jgi:hypothetical protein
LRRLIDTGRCPRFVSHWGVLPGGDCSFIMGALFANLAIGTVGTGSAPMLESTKKVLSSSPFRRQRFGLL